MQMDFQPGRRPDQLVTVLSGDLDLYVAPAFAQAVTSRIDAGASRVVIDFGEVNYLDSSGVGALIRLLQKAKLLGGELRVARLSGTPRKVLEMSNILSILKTVPDVETALQGWT